MMIIPLWWLQYVAGDLQTGSITVLLAVAVAVLNFLKLIPGSAFIHYVEGSNMLLEIAASLEGKKHGAMCSA